MIKEHEIAPYLPYGLKIRGKNSEYTLDASSYNQLFDGSMAEFQMPVLRPMEDLVKDIGLEEIPIITLFRMCTIEWSPLPSDFKFINNEEMIGVYFKDHQLIFAYHPSFNCFAGSKFGGAIHIGHDLEVFQKLFEWHFDVFDLIGQGLAIRK